MCVCVCIKKKFSPLLSLSLTQNIPAWKRNIVQKKREEQAATDASRQQQQDEWESKMAEIAAMPTWKRSIFLERNPQYKT